MMSEPVGTWDREGALEEPSVSWPSFPNITTTLLSTVAAAGIFLGVGTLTEQTWVTWIGFVVAAAILLSHIVRRRLVTARRARIADRLGAHLIGGCQPLGGPNYMQVYFDGRERVVLVLTDDALHIYQNEPMRVFSTIPFYNILDAQVGRVEEPRWVEDHVGQQFADERKVLNLAVQMSGQSVYRLAFADFDRHAPAARWAEALRQNSGLST